MCRKVIDQGHQDHTVPTSLASRSQAAGLWVFFDVVGLRNLFCIHFAYIRFCTTSTGQHQTWVQNQHFGTEIYPWCEACDNFRSKTNKFQKVLPIAKSLIAIVFRTGFAEIQKTSNGRHHPWHLQPLPSMVHLHPDEKHPQQLLGSASSHTSPRNSQSLYEPNFEPAQPSELLLAWHSVNPEINAVRTKYRYQPPSQRSQRTWNSWNLGSNPTPRPLHVRLLPWSSHGLRRCCSPDFPMSRLRHCKLFLFLTMWPSNRSQPQAKDQPNLHLHPLPELLMPLEDHRPPEISTGATHPAKLYLQLFQAILGSQWVLGLFVGQDSKSRSHGCPRPILREILAVLAPSVDATVIAMPQSPFGRRLTKETHETHPVEGQKGKLCH